MSERYAPSLPPPPARVHFVGIGGIGTSGLARILRAWGYDVSGSDGADSPLLRELASEGMRVAVGHTMLAKAAAADLVVVTAAARDDNPEIAAAHAAGKPVTKRAALLGALHDARDGVSVAGSHGKSTTSGMLATALLTLGADPSYAVGAVLSATGTNAAPGGGPHFVAEADEYDRSFLHLHPLVAVVTNLEYDHPDIFPDRDAYDEAFVQFVAGIRRAGTLVIPSDDPGIVRLRKRPDFDPPARVVTFGEGNPADWIVGQSGDGWQVSGPNGVVVTLRLRVPGRHNARNATAALATLATLGYAAADAARALETFAGVGRRFERKGEAAGVLVIDDYAHHPTEIAATLRAARDRFPGRRLWAAFQPHTFSRLKALLPEFAAAFADADRVAILDVYAARETDTLGVSADDLRALLSPDTLAPATPTDAARNLAALVEPGDVVLTLGAGSITDAGPLLLRLLAGQGGGDGDGDGGDGDDNPGLKPRAKETKDPEGPYEAKSSEGDTKTDPVDRDARRNRARETGDAQVWHLQNRPDLPSSSVPEGLRYRSPGFQPRAWQRADGTISAPPAIAPIGDAPPAAVRNAPALESSAAVAPAPADTGQSPGPAQSATPASTRGRPSRAPGVPIPGTDLSAQPDSPMRLWTTWHVGGTADLLVRPGTPDDVATAARWGTAQGLPVTVVGGGSNLLVGDGGIRGLVILCRTPGERAEHLVEVEDLGEAVRLRVGANAPLSWTGRYAAERGWSGLDWAVGLPGTVGGATVNNAGAHGTEQKDHLETVEVLDLPSGDVTVHPAAWLEPAYRHTRIKAAPRPRPWVVLRVTMRLPKGDRAELVRLADEHADFRKRTQPGGSTGGSTFANPPGDHAGRLLEAAGMKGERIGGAGFSPLHANWIVNDGAATAADIRALIALARERVRERFGIELRQEVEEIGEP